MKWTEEEVSLAIKLVNENKNFKEIGIIINKTHLSVTSKMRGLGIKSGHIHGKNKGETKYVDYDWDLIQGEYDKGLSHNEIYCIYKGEISLRGLSWGVKNNKLKIRSLDQSIKLAWKNGKYKESNKIGLDRYRQLCEFKFNVYHFPNKFDLKLIEEFGWYKAKNRGDNQNGVSRDHMYSVKEGFLNNIDPFYVSHPANCEIMVNVKNNKKKTNCSITIEELYNRVKNW
jgi:hypothetical protein